MSGNTTVLVVGQILSLITTLVGLAVILFRESRAHRWANEDRQALARGQMQMSVQMTEGNVQAAQAYKEANAVNQKIEHLNSQLLAHTMATEPTRVLIVDDDLVSVRLATVTLRAAGVRVLVAGTEAETIAALTWHPHVILMDVALTDTVTNAGLYITQRLVESDPSVVVVLFSAAQLPTNVIKASGAKGAIWKPISIATFANEVDGYRVRPPSTPSPIAPITPTPITPPAA